MELQQIIVAGIVCFCMIWASVRIFLFFRNIRKGSNPCASCPSECNLRSMRRQAMCQNEKKQRKVRKKR